jgi:hypothetical protein
MTPMLILAALANVGEAPVAIKFNAELFPLESLQRCGAKFPGQVSVGEFGHVTLRVTGASARDTLRRFTAALLESARERD